MGLFLASLAFHPRPAAADATAALMEAEAYLAERKWAEAVIAFRTVLRHQPGSIYAKFGLSRALVFSGRREEALSTLIRKAENSRQTDREAIARRVDVLSRVFLTNNSFQLFQDGVNALVAGKYRLARERLDKALEQEPDNVEVLVRAGQALLLDRDFDSAVERLRLARRLNPFDPMVRVWLGRTLSQRGEHREALTEFKSAIAERPDSELAVLWLAEAMVLSGQKLGAVRLLEEHVKRQPYHLKALALLGRYRLQFSGRDEQALWAARKDLQVALSRLDSGVATPVQASDAYALPEPKWESDLRAEILKLLEQSEIRDEAEKRKTE